MRNDYGVVVSGSAASTAASTKDSAIKITERRYCYSFWKQQPLSRRTMATQSSSSRSSLYSTSQCNNEKRSSETFKLQLKEAMHKLNDLGRKSRSEDKKKKKKKKKKQASNKDNSNSNSYERMIAEFVIGTRESSEGKDELGGTP